MVIGSSFSKLTPAEESLVGRCGTRPIVMLGHARLFLSGQPNEHKSLWQQSMISLSISMISTMIHDLLLHLHNLSTRIHDLLINLHDLSTMIHDLLIYLLDLPTIYP
ncbi:hypothetical protein CEXT_581871 [Caerostris extrusa]|uniref:Uncharacterized protein n=1 Tax=Caerostris extrusa TaxID=172846 RepID=A0AAV4R1U5_CAEEX|nr:hypothetical protein CEXT_581871 [Caerostris extrusa]